MPKHRIRTIQQMEEAAALKKSQQSGRRTATAQGAASGSGSHSLVDLASRDWHPDVDARTARRDREEEMARRRVGIIDEEEGEEDEDDDDFVEERIRYASSSESEVPRGRRIRRRDQSEEPAETQEATASSSAKKTRPTKQRLRKRARSVESDEDQAASAPPPAKKARRTKRRLGKKKNKWVGDAGFIDDRETARQIADSESYEASSEEGEEEEEEEEEYASDVTVSIPSDVLQDEPALAKVVEEPPQAEASLKKRLALVENNPYQFIVNQLILEAHDVLIIGENERYSMTLALAAMRKSFSGIWCSRTDTAEFKPMQMHDLLLQNYASAVYEFGHPGCESCEINRPKGIWKKRLQTDLRQLTQLDLARLDLNFWAHQLNQESLPYSDVPKHFIWMLPPAPTGELSGQEAGYLQSFLYECYHAQKEGDVVLITLSDEEASSNHFNIAGLLKLSKALGYKHWTDDAFVRDNCQHNGYHTHQGPRKAGGVNTTWTTYIFMKVTKAPRPPKPEWIKATDLLPSEPPRPHASITVPIPAPSEPPSPVVPASFFQRSVAVSPECPPPSPLVSPKQEKKVRKSPRDHPTGPNPAYIDMLPGADEVGLEADTSTERLRALSPEYPPPPSPSPVSASRELRSSTSRRKVRKSPRDHPTGPNPAYIDILPGADVGEDMEE